MVHRYWNGSAWVRVSDVEARLRRAHGQKVVAEPGKPAPPAPLPVKPLADLPPATPRTVAFRVAPETRVTVAVEPPTPRTITMQNVKPPATPMPPADLSDEELERLTKPGS